ncbi:MAG: tetratricopeptide repeat protein [Hyphomicrobium sp.]
MSKCNLRQGSGARGPRARLALVAMASLSLGACAGVGDMTPGFLASAEPAPASDRAGAPPADAAAGSANELQKATEYWGKAYAQKPQDLEAALAYAKNLKAMGQKTQAVAVLQQASVYHGANKKLASEYGRLALELDQVSVAQQLLALADDPVDPDWRVISARGTALAKQGKYQDAIPFYERAMTLAPGKPSIMNNLALAFTMNGEAAKAEDLLRSAGQSNPGNAKVNQNLALVLGLQGKYDEATKVASQQLPAGTAASNTALVRQMVKLEPKVMPQGVIAMPPPVQVAGSAANPVIPGLKPAVTSEASATNGASSWATKVAAAPTAVTPAVVPATVKTPAAPSAPSTAASNDATNGGDAMLRPSAP